MFQVVKLAALSAALAAALVTVSEQGRSVGDATRSGESIVVVGPRPSPRLAPPLGCADTSPSARGVGCPEEGGAARPAVDRLQGTDAAQPARPRRLAAASSS